MRQADEIHCSAGCELRDIEIRASEAMIKRTNNEDKGESTNGATSLGRH
jgi:hypothetical protein